VSGATTAGDFQAAYAKADFIAAWRSMARGIATPIAARIVPRTPRQPENTQRAFGHRASRAIPYSTIFNY